MSRSVRENPKMYVFSTDGEEGENSAGKKKKKKKKNKKGGEFVVVIVLGVVSPSAWFDFLLLPEPSMVFTDENRVCMSRLDLLFCLRRGFPY